MKQLLFIFSIFTLLFTSCIKDSDNYYFETLPIDSYVVPDTLFLDSVQEITISYTLPDNSYSFYNLYYASQDSTRTVAVTAYVDADASTEGPTVSKDFSFDLNVSQTESYLFKFWKGKNEDDEDVFDTVTVPVVDLSQN